MDWFKINKSNTPKKILNTLGLLFITITSNADQLYSISNTDKVESPYKFIEMRKASGNANTIGSTSVHFFQSNNCTDYVGGVTSIASQSNAIDNSSIITFYGDKIFNLGAQFGIKNMSSIKSIAISLHSSDTIVPVANFTGSECGQNRSYCCIPVSCENETCIPTTKLPIQAFSLKKQPEVGDPAEGGVIACTDGGSNNLIVPYSDNNKNIPWEPTDLKKQITIGEDADSLNSGAVNTRAIFKKFTKNKDLEFDPSSYAAGICAQFSTMGGYNIGWFLPAQNQMECIYKNREKIGGFSKDNYWTSTEGSIKSSAPQSTAIFQSFTINISGQDRKSQEYSVRCAKTFDVDS